MSRVTHTLVDAQTRRNCDRFKGEQAASRYPSEYRENNKRDQREKNAILRCLEKIPADAHVLDFPCGTGRLTKLLQEKFVMISGADGAASMVKLASANTGNGSPRTVAVQFYESDVFDSGFTDGQFDSVVCNRLFHHFTEATDRVKALSELRRISKGSIVISFFNSFSTSMAFRKIGKYVRGRRFEDRVGVSMNQFMQEVESCGLKVTYATASRWGISPLWYIIVE